MLVEAGALVFPAAVLAIVLTLAVLNLLRPFYPPGVPLIPAIDVVRPSVFGFTLAAAILTVAVAGIVPALKVSRVNLATTIQDSGRTASPGQSNRRTVRTLVSTEVALTLVLLILAGLMIESVNRLLRVDPGFNAANLLTLTISLPTNKFDWDHNVTFSRQVMRSVENLPDVQKSAMMQGLPMHPGSFWGNYLIDGMSPPAVSATSVAELPVARLRVISPSYFDVMKIPIIAGRDFDERDDRGDRGTAPYVIVNQTLAQRHWPDQEAIGRRLVCPADCWLPEGQSSVIIGVVDDVKYLGLDLQSEPHVYLPEGRYPQAAMTLLVRTGVAPLNSVENIRSRISQVDNEAFVSDVRLMTDVLSGSIATRRFSTILLVSFASVALVLALVGIYGVIREAVAQQRPEIGIRTALGASPRQIVVLVLKYAFIPVSWGLAIGLVGAFLATPFASAFLFDVGALDFRIWATVPLLTLIACLLASYVPGRRAARIDPMAVLRHD